MAARNREGGYPAVKRKHFNSQDRSNSGENENRFSTVVETLTTSRNALENK